MRPLLHHSLPLHRPHGKRSCSMPLLPFLPLQGTLRRRHKLHTTFHDMALNVLLLLHLIFLLLLLLLLLLHLLLLLLLLLLFPAASLQWEEMLAFLSAEETRQGCGRWDSDCF